MEVPNVNPCHDKCHIFKVLSLQDCSICGIIDSILIRILKGRCIPLNRLLDEAFIMLLCAGAGIFAMQTITPVLALLLAIGLVCTLHYFSKAPTLLYSIGAFSICCLFCPPFFCAMPLLCYHALWSGKWWLILPSAGALFQLHMFTPIQLLLIVSGFCTAGLLYHRTTVLEQVTDLPRNNSCCSKPKIRRLLQHKIMKSIWQCSKNETALHGKFMTMSDIC